MLVALLAPSALAFEIATVTAARDESGQLWVTTRIDQPVETRVARSLERGMPATLLLHAELWRHRTGWFDRMERAGDAVVRMRHDIWHEEWRLERAGAPPLVMKDVDSLEAALSRPLVLQVPGLDHVPEEARCYVVVTATVKPLSVEDAEEVEGWVSGEVRDQRHAGFGVITQLPRSLFDAVRNFTGFGDSRDQAQTPEFTPGSLPVLKNVR
jgi:hypothetical protein